MTRVGDDARTPAGRRTVGIYLGGTPDDGGTYQNALSLVKALGELPPDRFRVIAFCEDAEWLSVANACGLLAEPVVRQGFASRALTKALRQTAPESDALKRTSSRVVPFGRQLEDLGVELCLYPDHEHFAWELATPSLGQIHDLMHRYEPTFPEVSEPGVAERRDLMYGRMRRGATAVLVDSELGKRQTIESYGPDGAEIHVLPYTAPHYIHEAAEKPPGSGEFDEWAREAALPERYLFYPAQFWSHKNHVRLLKAFARLLQRDPEARLVLSGARKNAWTEVAAQIADSGLGEAVSVLGYVTNEQMVHLYRHARALIYPSCFGPTNIPPLEAFALGCPCAASNVYAMPEQLGDAALLFDPRSEEEIFDACRRLWVDDDLCAVLRERGLAKAREWGPRQHAERLREIVEGILGRLERGDAASDGGA